MVNVGTEAKMATTQRGIRRIDTKRPGRPITGNIQITKIAWEGDKERVVAVSHGTVPQTKEASIWSWHEEFAVAWSETLITIKRKRNSNKGDRL
jgi:hypothetical protein